MDEEAKRETFTAAIGGRDILFFQPTEGQLTVIGRSVHKANRGGGKNIMEAVSMIFDVIDRLVVDSGDRDWLEEGLIDGSLDPNDFTSALDGINANKDDSPPTVKKTVASAARTKANGSG